MRYIILITFIGIDYYYKVFDRKFLSSTAWLPITKEKYNYIQYSQEGFDVSLKQCLDITNIEQYTGEEFSYAILRELVPEYFI